MSLFIHITQRCQDEAAGAGWQEDLERLKNKVEQAQDLQGFDHFPAPYRVKKKFPRFNARLIASTYAVGEHDVACFLSILTKADSAYDQFQKNPVEFGSRNFSGLVKIEELNRIVAERTVTTAPPPKPKPSEAEYSFLFRAGGGVELAKSDDGLICESQEWVRLVVESPIKERLTEFHSALNNLDQEKNFVSLPNRAGWGIFYIKYPQLNTTILLEPLTGNADKQLPILLEKYSALLNHNGKVTQELILRHCQRAYPDYLRFGEDEWLEVQKDAVANIALSPEETKVLEAARQPNGAFPLFINGRAGSGKSTLLQYIFAEHLHRYIQQEQDADFKPPLYLTCSSDLLKHSRAVVEKLLKCNASFLSANEPTTTSSKDHRGTMDSAFQEFRPFLLTHLSPETRNLLFRASHHVDFTQFRKHWQRKFGNDADARKRFGPDISWHIIRTYIKGMSAESYQDLDDYRQFDTKERLVSDEAFEIVFKKVWDNWYRPMCEDSGYWDDQDLARLLIEKDLIRPERPGVFCDEAQDFTRLELEIILRLCLFSNRTIDPHQISCIPLVFAGDPFQTLNPTGFRWEATKAAFVEKFVLSLDPNRRSGMEDLNYCELTYNYRSSRNIVLFSNLIQGLRCFLFDLRRVHPQDPWASEASSPPVVWFDASDAAFWDRLRRERGITLIVPCGEGEEQEFIQNHLTKWIRLDNNGVPLDLNVFSAGRSKGLEFDRVAVFGFGDYIHDDLLAPLRERVATLDADKSLPLEYFINRFYVAVSRPKRRLFIIDTAVGRKRLWEFATNQKLEEIILKDLNDVKNWEGKIGGMIDGTLGHLDTDESPNLEEEARNIETQGLTRSDAYLLRAASNRYRLAGIPAKASYCSAEALFVDESFSEAGRAFLDCGHPARAIDAFWRSGRSSDKYLVEAAAAMPELQGRLEVIFSNFLAAPRNYSEGFAVLQKLSDRTVDPNEAVLLTSCNYWTEPTRQVAEKVVEIGERQIESPDWGNLSSLLTRLDTAGFRFKQSWRARVFYLAGDWLNSVALWEAAKDKNSKEYREAKARVAPYPERLAYLKELGKYDVIMEAFESNRNVEIDSENKKTVGLALLSAKRFSESLEIFVQAGAIQELGELASLALVDNQREIAKKAIRLCAILAVQHSHWAAVRDYINNGYLPKASKEAQKHLIPVLNEIKPQINRLMVASFARSESLTKLDGSEQKPISTFLRDFEKSKYWHGSITINELGAAIERSQRFVDAVEFYESALRAAQTDSEKRFARVRWVKSKERLESFYRGEKHYRRADEARDEIAKYKTTHIITPSELAVEYPELDSLNDLIHRELKEINGLPPVIVLPKIVEADVPNLAPETTIKATNSLGPRALILADAEMVIGQLKLKISRENKRINLEHMITSWTSSIRIEPIRCTSEDVVWKLDELNGLVYTCHEWEITVNFSNLDKDKAITFYFHSFGIEFVIRSI